MANYLIIRLSAIGDVAMTIPVIYSVAKKNPADSFTVLTQGFLEPLFINRPLNVEVVTVDLKGPQKSIAGLMWFVRQLSRNGYDVVLDLHDVLRTKLIRSVLRLYGSKIYIIDKARKARKVLTRRKDKQLIPLRPVTERYTDVFRQAGIQVEESFISLFEEQPDLSRLSLPAGEKNGFWIGVTPFAKHEGKIYPPGHMEQVIATLSKRKDVTIFLFGGKGAEAELLNEWSSRYPNVFSMAGVYTLDNELRLMNHLDVLVSMDSANMHFASLVNTRVVSVWGATHPFAGFYGYRQNPEDAVQLSLYCRPCSAFGQKPCYRGDRACMMQLSPLAIIHKIENILK